mmetsp:Transcript_2796/g.6246  ORF Transcript_2796/g.6246 Transcript_2796/m.6246 type:complete len:260 (+) Transcript_2796:315-1094(+)
MPRNTPIPPRPPVARAIRSPLPPTDRATDPAAILAPAATPETAGATSSSPIWRTPPRDRGRPPPPGPTSSGRSDGSSGSSTVPPAGWSPSGLPADRRDTTTRALRACWPSTWSRRRPSPSAFPWCCRRRRPSPPRFRRRKRAPRDPRLRPRKNPAATTTRTRAGPFTTSWPVRRGRGWTWRWPTPRTRSGGGRRPPRLRGIPTNLWTPWPSRSWTGPTRSCRPSSSCLRASGRWSKTCCRQAVAAKLFRPKPPVGSWTG